MVVKSQENLIGAWAYFAGVILAVIAGIFQTQLGQYGSWIYIVLAVMGILVGLLNVSDKDIDKFLLASVSIVIISYMGQTSLRIVSNIGLIMVNILIALLVMFIPATIIVALKSVFSISRTRF